MVLLIKKLISKIVYVTMLSTLICIGGIIVLTLWISVTISLLPIVIPCTVAYGIYKGVSWFFKNKESWFLQSLLVVLVIAVVTYGFWALPLFLSLFRL